ncbi:hypothetical protein EDB19DRAFT_1724599 [Suillus lakei]|nr:hypothetical protein EDB19DRAFT_1724599 [Suillus lakei]
MSICSYYLRGACKYGDRCRNEHPADRAQQSSFGNQSWTNNNSRDMAVPYTTESIARDVTALQDKPLWPLSSYGAAKYEPVVIVGLDESFEELRVKAGTINEYMKYESDKIAASEQAYNNAKEQPAFKLSKEAALPGSSALDHVSAFGGRSAFGSGSALSAVPQPSVSGTASSAFGKSAFGQPAFGQTGFGTSAVASAFGQPAQTMSAFGQPQQSTSAFGQPAQTTSAFGQPPSSAFGQPSAFAHLALRQHLGAPALALEPVAGFLPSHLSRHPGLRQYRHKHRRLDSRHLEPLPRGQHKVHLLLPTQVQSAFSSAAPAQSAFSSATPSPSAFGSTPSAPSAIGGSSVALQSAFGSAPTTSAFGSTGAGAPSFGVAAPVVATAFTTPMATTPTDASKPSASAPGFSRSKIQIKPDRYAALLPPNYMDLLPADVKAAFAAEKFEWGKIPEWIPPKEVR